MLVLHQLGLVDRFALPLVRSGPTFYVLDHLGARILAAHRGIEFKELAWRKEDVEALPFRGDFRHLVAANEFFVRLADACRRDGVHALMKWEGERGCRRRWGEYLQPDGYGRLQGPEGSIEFFLEMDRGTESPARLAAKLPRYHELAVLDDFPDAVLFSFPDPECEVAARKRLYNPRRTLATSVSALVNADPLGAVWLPLGATRRVRLLQMRRVREASPGCQVAVEDGG